MQQALARESETLQSLAAACLTGDIDAAEMHEEIGDERERLRTALLACEVRAKGVAQKASNAATRVVVAALQAAVKA